MPPTRNVFDRTAALGRLRSGTFDVLVIGGGITGAGVALDAAARGLRVALVEREDLASGTSGRSSRLVHGGLRYLQKGELGLVVESLSERQRLLANAAHLVRPLAFVIPLLGIKGVLDTAVTRAYQSALRSYDLAGGRRIGHSHKMVDAGEVREHLGFIRTERLLAGLVYWDAHTDDARLTLAVARTAAEHGAVVVTYATVTELLRDERGQVSGVRLAVADPRDIFDVAARVVVNATGVWAEKTEALLDRATASGGDRRDEPSDSAPPVVPAPTAAGTVQAALGSAMGLGGTLRRAGLAGMTGAAKAATATGLAAKLGLAAPPDRPGRGGLTGLAGLARRTGLDRWTAPGRPVSPRPATGARRSSRAGAEGGLRLRPAKGIHITVPANRLPCDMAAVLPGPGDKRSIFVIPWGGQVYVGTTDTDYLGSMEEPRATADDVDYLLRALNASVAEALTTSDVTGVWAGLRPLVADNGGAMSARTSDLSRHHRVAVSPSGLVSVTGGKLTTYRRMAAETVDVVVRRLSPGRPTRRQRRSPTVSLSLWGSSGAAELAQPGMAARLGTDAATLEHLVSRHGGQARAVLDLVEARPELGGPMVEGLPYLAAEAVFAVRHEMAHTLTDILARRTHAMQRDRLATVRAAPDVAALVAAEAGWDDEEVRRQVAQVQATVARDSEAAGLSRLSRR